MNDNKNECLLMIEQMGENSKKLLLEKYIVDFSYQKIISKIK